MPSSFTHTGVGTREDIARMKDFVRRAHRLQQEDPGTRAELDAFTGHRPDAADGVPPVSAGHRPEAQDEWAFRDFDPGQTHERLPGKDYESNPMVAVVCSFCDGPR